jgi:hypothetical protein
MLTKLIITILTLSPLLADIEVTGSDFIISEKNQLDIEAFKIIKIDSIGIIYLIYAERNDSIFKIVSKKEEVNDCQKIGIGKFYKLNIISWFLPEESNVKLRLSGVKIENRIISIERDSIVGDIFLTKDLKGLCYSCKR